jgi:K+ transporter
VDQLAGQDTAPLALRANVEHNQVLHQHVVILAIATMPVPHVPAAERITVDELGYQDDRIVHVTARFGYMDQQDVPGLLPLIRQANTEGTLDRDKLSYFLSRIEIVPGGTPGLSRWRNGSSSRRHGSLPTPPSTSAFRATRPWSWDRASSCSVPRRRRVCG